MVILGTAAFASLTRLGQLSGSTRTADQWALAPFWEGNASVHWNQAANQIARSNELSMSDSNRLLAVLNIAIADTAFTIWSSKRFYGADASEVTWRPVTSIPLADIDGNPDTATDPNWLPLVTTPSHPEIPGRASQPERSGRDGSSQPILRWCTVIQADDRTCYVVEAIATSYLPSPGLLARGEYAMRTVAQYLTIAALLLGVGAPTTI